MGAEIAQVTALSPRQDDAGLPPGRVPAASEMLAGGCVIPGVGLQSGEGVLSGTDVLPVLPALRELLPAGLQRGSVVSAGECGLLCLALAAGASQ